MFARGRMITSLRFLTNWGNSEMIKQLLSRFYFEWRSLLSKLNNYRTILDGPRNKLTNLNMLKVVDLTSRVLLETREDSRDLFSVPKSKSLYTTLFDPQLVPHQGRRCFYLLVREQRRRRMNRASFSLSWHDSFEHDEHPQVTFLSNRFSSPICNGSTAFNYNDWNKRRYICLWCSAENLPRNIAQVSCHFRYSIISSARREDITVTLLIFVSRYLFFKNVKVEHCDVAYPTLL